LEWGFAIIFSKLSMGKNLLAVLENYFQIKLVFFTIDMVEKLKFFNKEVATVEAFTRL
jgi:hypothetical protein